MNIIKYIKKPSRIVSTALAMYGGWIPDKIYLRILYFIRMGKRLNLKNPQTFSEKLQWLKLYNRKSEYTRMVDKYAVKEYVSNIIGDKYVIPTLGVWDTPEDIDWDVLPNKFVLKTTHGGGSIGVAICKDKSTFDREKAIAKLKRSMKQDIFRSLREWPYKNVKKRIIAEELLEDDKNSTGGSLNDYKFYCFNGQVIYCEVITGRYTKKAIDFFDLDWNHVDFCFEDYNYSKIPITKPTNFDEMVNIVGKLCKGLPYSRIDVYSVNGKVFFGEITFYPASGFRGFYPEKWNQKLGDMIDLNILNK